MKKKISCRKNEQKNAYDKALENYRRFLSKKEQSVHRQIRGLFKHNIFNIRLPEHSLLQDDLFSQSTWEFLGLTDRQIIIAGAMGGAAVGAGVDLAAAGLSFGIFSALGTVVGGLGTAVKGKKWLSDMKVLGMQIGGEQLQVGPVNNPQLLYILLDRVLLFYSHIINWAHGRREYDEHKFEYSSGSKGGFTSSWSKRDRDICSQFFKIVTSDANRRSNQVTDAMRELLRGHLLQISEQGADRSFP